MKRIHLSFIVAIVAAISLTACKHKELCYTHPHTTRVDVAFDWMNAPAASPETMSVYLFPEGGGAPRRFEFTDITGGTIEIAPGKYNGFCLNSDTENLLYRGNSWNSFETYSRTTELLRSLGMRSESAPRANGTEQDQVVMSPEMIWADRVLEIEIEMDVDQTVTFYPAVSVSSYTYEITNADNLQYVIGMSGSLSGMAGGMFNGENTLSEPSCIIPFGSVITLPDTIEGQFLTFGAHHSQSYSHKLVIYAVLADNSKWFYTYDVTGQVRTAADPLHVHIVLNGLPLPQPLPGGGGLDPEVDEWGDVEENIEM